MSNIGTQRLFFAYISAVIIIALLLTASQLIIQATLFAEVSSRDQATVLNQQELRTQRLLRNSLLLLSRTDDHTVPMAELNQDIPAWQQTEQDLERSLSTEHAARLAGAKDDYNKMRDALLTLTAEEKKSSPDQAKVVQSIATVFYSQRAYLGTLVTIYSLLSQAADDDVARVRIIELVIYAASLIVLIVEALVVIRPALADYKRTLEMLEKVSQEQAKKAE